MSGIISLTGDLGSGKSTVSTILCKQLHYEYIYTGQIQRRIAERYAMTTNELNVYAETHPEIDREIDDTFKSLVLLTFSRVKQSANKIIFVGGALIWGHPLRIN